MGFRASGEQVSHQLVGIGEVVVRHGARRYLAMT
jgi:hypothetical protein